VISTGDEIVPVDWLPRPGQIRNSNLYSIASLITSAGGVPVLLDIVPDDELLLLDSLENGLAQADALAFTGGSSVGERDLIVKVLTGMPGAEMLAHGVAISPGKPTLLAQVGSKAVFGLPGHPVSAWMVASIFLTAFIKYLEGEELRKGPFGERTGAILAAPVHSAQGREEYVRVRLERRDDGLYAIPLFGKSGVLSTLAKADGLLVVPTHAEGLPAGEHVDVIRL
jgi:molybdopterin molybdotransferase